MKREVDDVPLSATFSLGRAGEGGGDIRILYILTS